MEITTEQIIEAIKANENLVTGILPSIQESAQFKTMFDNKVQHEYTTRIGSEVEKIHSQYDKQFHEHLGQGPGTREDGTKQKTYEYLNQVLIDYKKLKDGNAAVSVDARVKELERELEKARNGGPGREVYNELNEVRRLAAENQTKWEKQLAEKNQEISSFQKNTMIDSAIAQLKFNPDVPESLRGIVLNSVKQKLSNTSEIKEGMLIFKDANGNPLLNQQTYANISVSDMLKQMDEIKQITIDPSTQQQGGGAATSVPGRVATQQVEGKDQKRLQISPGSFTTQAEFFAIANKALQAAGIPVTDMQYSKLRDAAFIEHQVSKLPSN